MFNQFGALYIELHMLCTMLSLHKYVLSHGNLLHFINIFVKFLLIFYWTFNYILFIIYDYFVPAYFHMAQWRPGPT